MTGTVFAIIRGKGYGFLRDSESNERFFHANNLRGIEFADLEEGMSVEFKPIQAQGHGNGLRAECVRVI